MITALLAKFFSSGVRHRGDDYVRRRLVKLGPRKPDGGFSAKVRGTEIYRVDVECLSNDDTTHFDVDCSCPYVKSNSEPCKHIWASMLVGDRAGYFHRLEFTTKSVSVSLMEYTNQPEEAESYPAEPAEPPIQEVAAPVAITPPSPESDANQDNAKVHSEPSLSWLDQLKFAHLVPAPRHGTDRALEPIYVVEALSETIGSFDLSMKQFSNHAKAAREGGVSPMEITPADVARVREGADREICRMLVGVGVPQSIRHDRPSCWTIAPELMLDLLPKLFSTGRLHFRRKRFDTPMPLLWDEGEAWDLFAQVIPQPGGTRFKITTRLRRGTDSRDIENHDVFFAGDPGLLLRGNRLSLVRYHGSSGWLGAVRRSKPFIFSTKQKTRVVSELMEIGGVPPLDLPPELGIRELKGIVPEPEIAFSVRKGSPQVDVAVRFLYGDSASIGMEPFETSSRSQQVKAGKYITTSDGLMVHRNREFERERAARLKDLGIRQIYFDSAAMSVSAKAVPDLVTILLAEGWRVLGSQGLYRRPGEFKLGLSSGVDWFDVAGGVDFDGQSVPLPQLLDAMHRGDKFIVLGDGSMGIMPEDWLAKNARWLEMGQADGDKIRFTSAQLPVVDAMLSSLKEVNVDQGIRTARARLHGFDGIQPAPVPPGFNGVLRPYQQQGLGWLAFLREFGWGGCLADDMGLGKTIQLLALLSSLKQKGELGLSLVIAPKSLVFNWAREAAKFTPDLKVLAYTGLERAAARKSLKKHDLLLTTYGTMLRDITHLAKEEFHYVVLDEAQAIKNPESQSAKAARLLKAKHRLALTGTPVENHLGDLWSIFEFLNPGMLGALPAFKGAVASRPDATDPADVNNALMPLRRALRPFVLRRTKAEVLTDLPARTEQTITCQMGKEQTALYEELREHYRASVMGHVAKEGLEKSTFQVLEALLRLRQAACHPALINDDKAGIESAKLEALIPMLLELIDGGHKALVFSQFTSLLKLVRTELDNHKIDYEYLDGKTRKRETHVDRFQTDPKCSLMLISLKAGGVGLNLTAADYVFILDPWWNPAAEAQAIDRAHRMGQTRNVTAYRLIAQGTVEEKIIQLQQSKRALADAIISQENGVIAGLTKKELADLLS